MNMQKGKKKKTQPKFEEMKQATSRFRHRRAVGVKGTVNSRASVTNQKDAVPAVKEPKSGGVASHRGKGHTKKPAQPILEGHRFELPGSTYMQTFSINTQLILHVPGCPVCRFSQLQMENSIFNPCLGTWGCGGPTVRTIVCHLCRVGQKVCYGSSSA